MNFKRKEVNVGEEGRFSLQERFCFFWGGRGGEPSFGRCHETKSGKNEDAVGGERQIAGFT